VIPHLGKGQAHWRQGYSAHALATAWFMHNGLPPTVRALLDGHDRFRGAELVDAILERKTDLRDGVRGQSQTDLLAILGLGRNLAAAAVEGKVDESFGPLISEWLTDDPQKHSRLGALTKLLGTTGHEIFVLRYQLFHRTVSAIYEAERYRALTALMLVHSFSARRSGWADFTAFVRAIDLTEDVKPDEILGPKRVRAVELYAAWLADKLPTSAE
jgi:hypothetical protein